MAKKEVRITTLVTRPEAPRRRYRWAPVVWPTLALLMIFLAACSGTESGEDPVAVTVAASTYIGSAPVFVAFADMFIATNISRILVATDHGIDSPNDLRNISSGAR